MSRYIILVSYSLFRPCLTYAAGRNRYSNEILTSPENINIGSLGKYTPKLNSNIIDIFANYDEILDSAHKNTARYRYQ